MECLRYGKSVDGSVTWPASALAFNEDTAVQSLRRWSSGGTRDDTSVCVSSSGSSRRDKGVSASTFLQRARGHQKWMGDNGERKESM